MRKGKLTTTAATALVFVLLIGIVNLFADFTYEGGRSIMGPFLGTLGASATVVGIVAGLGELLGYSLRSISGFLADKTHKYWIVTFVGYVVNMLAVPALALAGNWPLAAALMMAERTGRAIRRPAVETMLSYTGQKLGSGWVFGLNEALDQGGATIGPLVVSLVLALKGSYRQGFAILLISALLCLSMLIVARLRFPHPKALEQKTAEGLQTRGFSRAYWLYVAAGALIAAGFADFSLIAFHFQQARSVPVTLIPVWYAAAMAAGALSALVFGRLLDRVGFAMVLLAFFLSALFAPLVFLGQFWTPLLGMVLWGIGLGAQDSLLKALVSRIIAANKRSTAFGVFDTGFGIAWFLGSAVMGLLYDRSILALIVFSVGTQLVALPVLLLANRHHESLLLQRSPRY